MCVCVCRGVIANIRSLSLWENSDIFLDIIYALIVMSESRIEDSVSEFALFSAGTGLTSRNVC